MLGKIKALPEKTAFLTGIILLLLGLEISNILPLGIVSILIGCIPIFLGMLFIISASDKRNSNKDK